MDSYSSCPICTSNNSVKLWSASCSEQASHFLSPLQDRKRYEILKEHITYLQKSPYISIKKCLDCDFIYSFPYCAGDKKFYDLIFSKTNKYPQERWEFEKSIELISKSRYKNPRILEIGSGDGAFLKKLIHNKLTLKSCITSIEYSEYGKSKIKSLGINCLSIDIKDNKEKLPYKKYDFICLFQVLEHLDSLNQLITILKSLLSRKGKIIIAVPNEKIIDFNESNGALLDMPPNHVGRWSKSSFKKLCEINKLKLIDNHIEPFSLKKFLLMFFSYRFLRKSQDNNSIAAFIKYRINKNLVWILTRLFIIIDFLCSPLILLKILILGKSLGGETQLSIISMNN